MCSTHHLILRASFLLSSSAAATATATAATGRRRRRRCRRCCCRCCCCGGGGCCCSIVRIKGYYAASGWDPATGFGSVDYKKFEALLTSDLNATVVAEAKARLAEKQLQLQVAQKA
jgi:hypothetical protein